MLRDYKLQLTNIPSAPLCCIYIVSRMILITSILWIEALGHIKVKLPSLHLQWYNVYLLTLLHMCYADNIVLLLVVFMSSSISARMADMENTSCPATKKRRLALSKSIELQGINFLSLPEVFKKLNMRCSKGLNADLFLFKLLTRTLCQE
jgi:hypothetical protein